MVTGTTGKRSARSRQGALSGLTDKQLIQELHRELRRRTRLRPHAGKVTAILASSYIAEDNPLTSVATPEASLLEAEVRRDAADAIMAFPMLSAAEAAASLGVTARNPSDSLRKLALAGDYVLLKHQGRNHYPAFQFPSPATAEREQAVRRINRLLGAKDDPWGTASWWLHPNDALSGQSPADLLAAGGVDRLQRLAEVEVEDDLA